MAAMGGTENQGAALRLPVGSASVPHFYTLSKQRKEIRMFRQNLHAHSTYDDGKSTLIGHMLYDAKLIFADQA